MKDIIFWAITPGGSNNKNRRFVGTYHLQSVILMMVAICSSVKSIFITRRRRRSSENIIFQDNKCLFCEFLRTEGKVFCG
jgi:hypothetical protein